MTARGEFDRIADETHENLAESRRIGFDPCRGLGVNEIGEFEPVLPRNRSEDFDQGFAKINQFKPAGIQNNPTGLQIGRLENIVDHPLEPLRRAADQRDKARLFKSQRRLGEQFADANHAIHRGAEFVAHGREELALDLGCLEQLVREPHLTENRPRHDLRQQQYQQGHPAAEQEIDHPRQPITGKNLEFRSLGNNPQGYRLGAGETIGPRRAGDRVFAEPLTVPVQDRTRRGTMPRMQMETRLQPLKQQGIGYINPGETVLGLGIQPHHSIIADERHRIKSPNIHRAKQSAQKSRIQSGDNHARQTAITAANPARQAQAPLPGGCVAPGATDIEANGIIIQMDVKIIPRRFGIVQQQAITTSQWLGCRGDSLGLPPIRPEEAIAGARQGVALTLPDPIPIPSPGHSQRNILIRREQIIRTKLNLPLLEPLAATPSRSQ